MTIRVFPQAGHGIRLADYEGEGRAPFAEGYWETMLDWRRENVVRQDRRQ